MLLVLSDPIHHYNVSMNLSLFSDFQLNLMTHIISKTQINTILIRLVLDKIYYLLPLLLLQFLYMIILLHEYLVYLRTQLCNSNNFLNSKTLSLLFYSLKLHNTLQHHILYNFSLLNNLQLLTHYIQDQFLDFLSILTYFHHPLIDYSVHQPYFDLNDINMQINLIYINMQMLKLVIVILI